MRQKSMSDQGPAEKTVRDIRRKTRRHHSAEEKIRIVLEGLRASATAAEIRARAIAALHLPPEATALRRRFGNTLESGAH